MGVITIALVKALAISHLLRGPQLLIAVLLFFSADVFAKDIFKACIETKKAIEKRPSYDITWSTYLPETKETTNLFNTGNLSIPLVTGASSEATVMGVLGNPELTFKSSENKTSQAIQAISFDTIFSKVIEDKEKYPELVGYTMFDALKNSFSVSINDIYCDDYKNLNLRNVGKKKDALRRLMLVLLKANFSPYQAIDVINVDSRNAFLVRQGRGFEYHEMKDGKTFMVSTFGGKRTDVDIFLNSLSFDGKSDGDFEIAHEIVKNINSKSIQGWQKIIGLMKMQNYSELSVATVQEQIDYLTSH
ncbi:hypothetical protein CWC31_05185 [Pseudoalteromonas ruthenica]|uniref:hypothetical protein n=1 Tax=Pseudoalteromonas ruthenica TaxID=151081 RepID=UPI001109712E|nr:hypothetical protein [Pseudoalteromonas ruthenica]TLX51540.1 hypothetical protein CWC31_05185 [Pseudoalteromonas ruthenica]